MWKIIFLNDKMCPRSLVKTWTLHNWKNSDNFWEKIILCWKRDVLPRVTLHFCVACSPCTSSALSRPAPPGLQRAAPRASWRLPSPGSAGRRRWARGRSAPGRCATFFLRRTRTKLSQYHHNCLCLNVSAKLRRIKLNHYHQNCLFILLPN